MNATDVFINCPFSVDYRNRFWAITYAVLRSGLEPRCALEADNSIENRYDKICRLIRECRFGIHDISYTGLYGDPDRDADYPLPRFNMPFELGLFLGAHSFGGPKQRAKTALVLDIKAFRYQKFLSDIAGQDIRTYDGGVEALIAEVAIWLRTEARLIEVPGGSAIATEYAGFMESFPALCRESRLAPSEVTFLDFKRLAAVWIEQVYGQAQ
ncbi:hypothetical protein [Asticcacaulis sp.]|uniref:hypothetical protein n=1 Tax=Asticcacaulis sp. TaxID=1872648 RepID=UPI00391CF743